MVRHFSSCCCYSAVDVVGQRRNRLECWRENVWPLRNSFSWVVVVAAAVVAAAVVFDWMKKNVSGEDVADESNDYSRYWHGGGVDYHYYHCYYCYYCDGVGDVGGGGRVTTTTAREIWRLSSTLSVDVAVVHKRRRSFLI